MEIKARCPECKADIKLDIQEIHDPVDARRIKTHPELLSACEAIKHAMMETQGFAPDFLTNAINKARGV